MKSKKAVVMGSFIITAISVIGLIINGIKISELTKDTKNKIEIEKQELNKQEEKLSELQSELENIDSPEYIKKVAKEKLGMVEEDTIVFREKK